MASPTLAVAFAEISTLPETVALLARMALAVVFSAALYGIAVPSAAHAQGSEPPAQTEPRPEMRIAQHDVGDLRVTRHLRTLKVRARDATPPASLHARPRQDKRPRLRATENFA